MWLSDKEIIEEFFLDKKDEDEMINNFNLIVKCYNQNAPLFWGPSLQEKYERILEEKINEPIGTRFKKQGSVNHALWAKKLAWIEHFPEHKTYICTEGVNLIKTRKKTGYAVNQISINYFSTPRGMVYLNRDIPNKKIVALTSHFLDRLNQRVYENEITRMQAILKFVTTSVNKTHAIVCKNSVRCIDKNGVSFGNADVTDGQDFVLLSTFVSRDMLTKKQLAALDIISSGKLEQIIRIDDRTATHTS